MERMRAEALTGVGLLTSRNLDTFVRTQVSSDTVHAQCVATVGLGNALRAGDPLCATRPVGTINIMCHVSEPLDEAAMLEALALMSEAKALAIREAQVPSIVGKGWASGTGTDCLVIASPLPAEGQTPATFAGKHTAVGHVIGESVRAAVARGAGAYEWAAQ
jgi:adenosylcobinamide amidohydrolase